MRDGNETRIRVVLGEEEAKGAVTNVEAETILNGSSAETEGS